MIRGANPYPVQIGQMAYHAFDYRKAVNSFSRKLLDAQVHCSGHSAEFLHGSFSISCDLLAIGLFIEFRGFTNPDRLLLIIWGLAQFYLFEALGINGRVPPRDVASNLGVSVPTLYRWIPAST